MKILKLHRRIITVLPDFSDQEARKWFLKITQKREQIFEGILTYFDLILNVMTFRLLFFFSC